MKLIEVKIGALLMSNIQSSSMIFLKPVNEEDSNFTELPIRIGFADAAGIAVGLKEGIERPLTHDLLLNTIEALDAALINVVINKVEGTTFFAQLHLQSAFTGSISVDCRPSDAIALATRKDIPIFINEEVLQRAAYPDFTAVEKQVKEEEMQDFKDFLKDLKPEDFELDN